MALDQLVTLGALRDQVRFWADKPSLGRPTNAQLDVLINHMAKRMYGHLVLKHEHYFVTTSPNLVIAPGSDNIDLATALTAGAGGSSDFLKLLGVDAWTGSRWVPLDPFDFRERAEVHGREMRYQHRNAQLFFLPSPAPLSTVRVHYVPRLAQLTDPDASKIDGWNGWEQVLVLRCALVLRMRDEQDVSAVKEELARVTGELELEAKDRDLTGTRKVVDVRGWEDC